MGVLLPCTSSASLFTTLVMVSCDRKLSFRLLFRSATVSSSGFRALFRSVSLIFTSPPTPATVIFTLDSSDFTVLEI